MTPALGSGHDKFLDVEQLLVGEAEFDPPRPARLGRDGVAAVGSISWPVVGSHIESDLLLEDTVPQPSMLDCRARPRSDARVACRRTIARERHGRRQAHTAIRPAGHHQRHGCPAGCKSQPQRQPTMSPSQTGAAGRTASPPAPMAHPKPRSGVRPPAARRSRPLRRRTLALMERSPSRKPRRHWWEPGLCLSRVMLTLRPG